MADNPVAQAKAAYLAARSVWFNYCGTNEAALLDANAKLDALIAAVRAENDRPLSIYPDANRHYSFTDAVVDAAPHADFPSVTLRSLMREWLEEAARHPRYSALAKLLKRHAAAAKAGADALDAKPDTPR